MRIKTDMARALVDDAFAAVEAGTGRRPAARAGSQGRSGRSAPPRSPISPCAPAAARRSARSRRSSGASAIRARRGSWRPPPMPCYDFIGRALHRSAVDRPQRILRDRSRGMSLLLGAVAYDPKVVTIWDGFRSWLRDAAASTSTTSSTPITSARSSDLSRPHRRRLELTARLDARPPAGSGAGPCGRGRSPCATPTAICVRSIVVRADSPVHALADLRGQGRRRRAPSTRRRRRCCRCLCLRAAGLTPGADVTVRRFDVGVGPARRPHRRRARRSTGAGGRARSTRPA